MSFTIDLTLIAATALGSGITLAGIALNGYLESRRASQSAADLRTDEQRARIRARDLRALDETRQVLVAQLSWLERRVVLGDVRATGPDVDALTRFNINLVGDAGVIIRFGEVVTELQGGLPLTTHHAVQDLVRNLVPKSLADLDAGMIQRTARLRSDLLQALDNQEELVMRDEPMVRLSDENLEAIAPADAMVDALRERQRAHRSPRTR
jgi:hypothetical protein